MTLIESAVCDSALPQLAGEPVVLCDADPSGIGDEANWFMPNTRALQRWVERAGFDIERVNSWPEPASRVHLPNPSFEGATALPPVRRRL